MIHILIYNINSIQFRLTVYVMQLLYKINFQKRKKERKTKHIKNKGVKSKKKI